MLSLIFPPILLKLPQLDFHAHHATTTVLIKVTIISTMLKLVIDFSALIFLDIPAACDPTDHSPLLNTFVTWFPDTALTEWVCFCSVFPSF